MKTYTNNNITLTYNDKSVKVRTLNPLKSNKLVIELITAVTPSLGAIGDGVLSNDRSLTLSTAGQLLVQNLDADKIEEIQLLLLGGIENVEGEALEDADRISEYFSYNPDLDMLDVFVDTFEQTIVSKLLNSKLVKKFMPQITIIREQLSLDNSAEEHADDAE